MSRRPRSSPRELLGLDRMDPDRRNAVLLLGGIALILVFSFALIIYGYFTGRTDIGGQIVLQVGSRSFNYDYLKQRVEFEIAVGQFNMSNFGDGVINVLAEIQSEEIVRLIARERGLTVTGEEIDEQVKVLLDLPADAPRDVVAQQLRLELLATGASLGEYRDMARVHALEAKIRQDLQRDLPQEAEQVDLLIISAGTQAQAIQARDRLAAGESWADVAAELSVDESADEGGVLGWTPRGFLPEEVEEVAFNLGAGERSGIIETDEGFYILEARGKEVRAVEEQTADRLVEREFMTVIEQAHEEHETEILLTTGQLQRLAFDLGAVRV